jgi:hypothetical protein
MGYQIALLAPATRIFVGTADIPFETGLPTGTLIGQVYVLYGDAIGEVRAPRDGIIFGLRALFQEERAEAILDYCNRLDTADTVQPLLAACMMSQPAAML